MHTGEAVDMARKFDLEAFRFKLREKAPYFGHVMYGVRPVKSDAVTFTDQDGVKHNTLGVDEHGRLYHADEVDWTFGQTVAVLGHEMMHIVLRDAKRRMGRDPGMWNVAADLAINSILSQGQWDLPPDGQFPEKYGYPENLTAEEYYSRLMQDPNVPKIGVSGPPQPGNGHCGGVAGNPNDGEEGEPTDGNGMTSLELDAVATRVAQEVVKNRGSVPGALASWADSVLNPTVPWQNVLRANVKRCLTIVSGGASDFSFMRQSSRRESGDLILPALVTYKPEVVVFLDTSGSMSDAELLEGVGEVSGVVRHLAQRITVKTLDTEVHDTYKISNARELVGKKLSGRGGTDMRVALDDAQRMTPRPNIVVIFTDGETPWPDAAPRGAVVVVCLTRGTHDSTRQSVPSWAKVVQVK
jgi:predicted metal-dependent peptidase